MPVSLDSLPEPGSEAAAHSARLGELIRGEMALGPLSFSRFMELALYAPGLGYYSAGARKFGSGGDFVTAPELSPLFARCLARQCREVLDRLGSGQVLELGAGSGVMAADLLRELARLGCIPERYAILELSGELRERQRATLSERAPELLARVRWLECLPDGFRGVMLGNEVLDAMPVVRFRITGQGPVPLYVAAAGDGFRWTDGPADPGLERFVAALEGSLGRPLPVGYTSEYNPALEAWLRSLGHVMDAGLLLFTDYGYPGREYYHPQRDGGTLLCHYRHRAHENPLILPGLQDITANVDFTRLADAALAAGLEVAGYTTQAYFLLGCGLEELVAEADPADPVAYAELTRQVKLLTLPGEMGERFKAMALVKGLEGPLRGFGFLDQRERL